MLLALLEACGGSETNRPPIVQLAGFSTTEETAVSGVLSATDPEGQPLTFTVKSEAHHGQVTIVSSTGAFVYEPSVDFYGSDSFDYVASDGKRTSAPATVTITVDNVADMPVIEPIPALRNSADSEVTTYIVKVTDPDPERPILSVEAADPGVVDVAIDQSTGMLALSALRVGQSDITVHAADGTFTTASSFHFSATEITKRISVNLGATESSAIVLSNAAGREIDFVLTHNGFPVFENLEAIVEFVANLADEFPDEGFERKLWRFLRDSVYHEVPLDARRWLHDPWVTLNSLGWGFCSHVSGTYVEIARAAGYDARVWGLNGHVVPEIYVNGQWRMYDPDLAVYYRASDGSVASVDQLSDDPGLISMPIRSIFAGSPYQYPYSQQIADIYSSDLDNFNGDSLFIANEDTPSSRIVLPRGAKLTYPGKWTEAPDGVDGMVPHQVREFRQALLELSDGWTGTVNLPWVVWDISGTGQISIDGQPYDIGTATLTQRIRDSQSPVVALDVLAGSSVKLVFLINAVKFDLTPVTNLELAGLDVWAVQATTVQLPVENAAAASLDMALRKPQPTVIGP